MGSIAHASRGSDSLLAGSATQFAEAIQLPGPNGNDEGGTAAQFQAEFLDFLLQCVELLRELPDALLDEAVGGRGHHAVHHDAQFIGAEEG